MAGFFIWKIIQSVEIANGYTHTEIIMREDVEPAEREDQKHLRRPHADALDSDESLNNFLVGHAPQPVESQTAASDAFCQIEQVTRFLRRNANSSQLFRR